MNDQRVLKLHATYDTIQPGWSGLAVDIDDTLTLTTETFHAAWTARWPSPNAPTVEELKRAYALRGETPYWGEIPEAIEQGVKWSDDPEFNASIPLKPGVVELYTRLQEVGLLGCYATARVERARNATIKVFTQANMPDAPMTMRPNPVGFANNTPWKSELYRNVPSSIRGIIDDSARLAREVEQAGLDIPYFLFGRSYNDFEPEPGSCVIPTPDLETLESHIERHFL